MKNFGLIVPEICTREEGVEHVLGSAVKPIINEKGDWLPHLPDREPQNIKNVETSACTVYGTLSAIETLVFFHTGIKVNYSDRYVANVAKQRGILDPRYGADPHQIAELIRTVTGNLAEDKAPWGDDVQTVDDYYALKDLAELLKEGPAWYKEWKFEHEWVWTDRNLDPKVKRELLKEAAKRGSVCVSVYAWLKKNGLYYKPKGAIDGHWTQVGKILSTKDRIFDSYDTYLKDLTPNYDYALAKVYYLAPVKKKAFVFLNNLYYGQQHPDVEELQKALVSLGYKIPHAVTDFFLTETKTALAQFQARNGIEDDGSHFGPRTRYAMNRETKINETPYGALVLLIQRLFSGLWKS